MEAKVLIISDLELDAQRHERRLSEVGFSDVAFSHEEHLRSYLVSRPDLVVVDVFSEDERVSLLGSLSVGGWHSVNVPVIVVDDDPRGPLADADAVLRRDETDDLLAMTAMALYAERCRELVERARASHPTRGTLEAVTA